MRKPFNLLLATGNQLRQTETVSVYNLVGIEAETMDTKLALKFLNFYFAVGEF